MKRFMIFIVLLIGLGLMLQELVLAQGRPRGRQRGPMLIEASGEALWNHIKQVNYKNWRMWPGKEAFYKGTEPHGALLTTYVNGPAFRAVQARTGTLPVGSIIAKENFTPDKKLAAVTVMYKKRGYNPEGNDWFWAKYSPEGKVETEGKVEGCIGCHTKMKDNDFIMTEPLKK